MDKDNHIKTPHSKPPSFGTNTCNYFEEKRTSKFQKIYPLHNEKSGELSKEASKKRWLTFSFAVAQEGVTQVIRQNFINECPTCTACVSLRVNTKKFNVSRTQKKFRKKTGLTFETTTNENIDNDAMYGIYIKYMLARHAGDDGSMATWSKKRFNEWFSGSSTKMLAKKDGEIIGCSLLDTLNENTALYYTFFDPEHSNVSPGKQLWLASVEYAIDAGSQYVYIGPWAKNSPKLGYKETHSGLEAFIEGQWVDFNPEIHTQRSKNKTAPTLH